MLKNIKSYISIHLNIPLLYKHGYYSQEGEDIILQKIFLNKKRGFYVDVGAHHPFRYSNTYLLYKKGWKGINIDVTPGTKKMFDMARSKDVNLEVGIDKTQGIRTLFLFEDHALNTFSPNYYKNIVESNQSKLLKKIRVRTYPLRFILKKYAEEKNIDFLNIDVEGFELNVLESNNWKLYKPQVIVVENLSKNTKVENFLKNFNYSLKAQTLSSQIYVKS